MSGKTETGRQKLVAQIHIAKTQLGLDDDTYRANLEEVTGLASCAQMNVPQLHKVITRMQQLGFKSTKPKNGRRFSPKSGQAKYSEIDKIRAIWITMGREGFVIDGSETALNSFVRRITGEFGTATVSWLGYDEARKVLEALKAWHKRAMLARMADWGRAFGGDEIGYAKAIDIYKRLKQEQSA